MRQHWKQWWLWNQYLPSKFASIALLNIFWLLQLASNWNHSNCKLKLRLCNWSLIKMTSFFLSEVSTKNSSEAHTGYSCIAHWNFTHASGNSRTNLKKKRHQLSEHRWNFLLVQLRAWEKEVNTCLNYHCKLLKNIEEKKTISFIGGKKLSEHLE